jgi:hypothetical protein
MNLHNAIEALSPRGWEHQEEARGIVMELQRIAEGLMEHSRSSAAGIGTQRDRSSMASEECTILASGLTYGLTAAGSLLTGGSNGISTPYQQQLLLQQQTDGERDEERVEDSYAPERGFSALNPHLGSSAPPQSPPAINASRTPSEVPTICASTQHTLGTLGTGCTLGTASGARNVERPTHPNADIARQSITSSNGSEELLSQCRPKQLLRDGVEEDEEGVKGGGEEERVEETNMENSFVQETNMEDSYVQETIMEDSYVQETNVEDSYVPETEFNNTMHSSYPPTPLTPKDENAEPQGNTEPQETETQDVFKQLLMSHEQSQSTIPPPLPPRRTSSSSTKQPQLTPRNDGAGSNSQQTPSQGTSSSSKNVPSSCDMNRMFKHAFAHNENVQDVNSKQDSEVRRRTNSKTRELALPSSP